MPKNTRRIIDIPPLRYSEEVRPAGALSFIWGFKRAVYFCDVCGAPYRTQHKQGTYRMIGHRGGNLCVCWEQARGLCAEDDLAQGVPQGRYARFLDVADMWISDCPRSAVSLELEASGVGVGA